LIDGNEYDERDLARFNQIDAYTLMFIQHGQFKSTFDQERALKIFHDSMSWRKQHQVYGRNHINNRLEMTNIAR
jgi:hypothetical protein